MNPAEAIMMYMVKKGIDSDELFLYSGLLGDDLNQVLPIISQLSSAGYINIKEKRITMVGFEATLHNYSLTQDGNDKLDHVIDLLKSKWNEIMTLSSSLSASYSPSSTNNQEQEFQQLVAENEQWIYAMVMLEVASPADAEVILRAANRIAGNNNNQTDSSNSGSTTNTNEEQKARDDRWQSVFSESLTNLLGSHVQYG